MSLINHQASVQCTKSSSPACSAVPLQPSLNVSCPPTMAHINRNAFVGIDLGVPASPLEPFTSMDPKDYVWGTPSPQQQQHLFQQFMQMAFFCHLAQTANNMVNGAPSQPQLPFLPFPFPPFRHLPSVAFPFTPAMPPLPGFQQPPCSTLNASNPSCQATDTQKPTSAPFLPVVSNSLSSSCQDTAAVQPTSPSSAGSIAIPEPKDASCPGLEGCEIDCDVIQKLLDDADICTGHDNLDQVMHFEYMESPSGSDGSTATGETILGSGIDSPVSVNRQEAFTLGVPEPDNLSLSDEEFDAVMEGMNGFTTHGDFGDFDLNDIMSLEEKTTNVTVPGKPAVSIYLAAEKIKDRGTKKSKALKLQGGIAKSSRSKLSVISSVAAEDALESIAEFLLN